jgi:AcrR family transcriptional regulator
MSLAPVIDFKPRRKPRQKRSQVLVDTILEASLMILKEQGAKGLTTNNIAERAGVAIGSVYRYYPDKWTILADVYEARTAELKDYYIHGLSNPFEGLSAEESIHYFVAVPIGFAREMLSLHEEVFRAHHQYFHGRLRCITDIENWREDCENICRRWLELHKDRLRVSDLDHAAFIMNNAICSNIDICLENRPQYLKDEKFVESLVESLRRYLLA